MHLFELLIVDRAEKDLAMDGADDVVRGTPYVWVDFIREYRRATIYTEKGVLPNQLL